MDWVNPQRYPQALVTITDFDGGFVFRDVPATTYWLWAGNARGQAARPRFGGISPFIHTNRLKSPPDLID